MTVTAPAAFLSHSSADRDLALRLATDLRAAHIDVWYAEWEIAPGDSLRRKIDEGIDRATHFLVLLTPASLQSEWVQTELDAGMVQRINGKCRLIPILSGIESADVPATLRGMKWLRLDNYDDGLRELVAACHEVSSKPPLGPVPPFVGGEEVPDLGLSPLAQRLARLLAERSDNGLPPVSMQAAEDVMDALGITANELAMAADELNDLGWVRLSDEKPAGPSGFRRIGPKAELFFSVDPYVTGWTPQADAKTLAAAMVNTGKDHPMLAEVARLLGWEPRRFNPAVYFLDVYGHVHGLTEMGSYPYAFHRVAVTVKTYRFAAT